MLPFVDIWKLLSVHFNVCYFIVKVPKYQLLKICIRIASGRPLFWETNNRCIVYALWSLLSLASRFKKTPPKPLCTQSVVTFQSVTVVTSKLMRSTPLKTRVKLVLMFQEWRWDASQRWTRSAPWRRRGARSRTGSYTITCGNYINSNNGDQPLSW